MARGLNGFRLAASRVGQFAAWSRAPSHCLSPKAQTARLWLAMIRLQQGFGPGEMGFEDKFEWSLSALDLGCSLIRGARWLCQRRMLRCLDFRALRASAPRATVTGPFSDTHASYCGEVPKPSEIVRAKFYSARLGGGVWLCGVVNRAVIVIMSGWKLKLAAQTFGRVVNLSIGKSGL